MPTALKSTQNNTRESIHKYEVIRIYYQLVKKGYPPEQTRRDLGLSLQDIEDFDFSVFNKAV